MRKKPLLIILVRYSEENHLGVGILYTNFVRLLNGGIKMNMYYGLVLLGVVVASFAQILLKKGANRVHISLIKDYLNAPVILGYFMMTSAVVLSMIAYRGVSYMNIPVLEGVGFVLVPVLSFVFLGEKFTKNKVLGIIFIFIGIGVYYLL